MDDLFESLIYINYIYIIGIFSTFAIRIKIQNILVLIPDNHLLVSFSVNRFLKNTMIKAIKQSSILVSTFMFIRCNKI